MENGPKPGADPRVLLAAERTLLAWIRTGIALMGFGFLIARFSGDLPAESNHEQAIGAGLIAAGVLVNAWASSRHRSVFRRLLAGETDIGVRGPVTVGLATVVGGIILIAVLLRDLLV